MRKDQVICCFFWGHGQLLGHVALHVVAHGNPSPMTPVGSIIVQKVLWAKLFRSNSTEFRETTRITEIQTS